MKYRFLQLLAITLLVLSCETLDKTKEPAPFLWENANVYFLLTDRFHNGDTANDINFERNKETAVLRGFEGGDFKGITQKIKEGYFTDLGINALWLSPVSEQVHGGTDEGTGYTYAFHGYWIKDWTAIEPNFGTAEELKEMVDVAHSKGIRVLFDAVINHTGPVTEVDPVWPESWVRTEPKCQFDSYESTISCTLVENLPDIKTESDEEVELPEQLVSKWKNEGRYEQEIEELNAFFERTGYPRAPRFYIIKWLTDYITEYGIDGYRVDTVKHVEETVWEEFRDECDYSFAEYKKNNPDKVMGDQGFYLTGEVYNYGITMGKKFSYGDVKVDYFKKAFNSLINFDLKWQAREWSYEDIFSKYDFIQKTELKGKSVLNYLSSHDDGSPYDQKREKVFMAANMLFFTPGAAQVYYGDETARSLVVEGAIGDATLRSLMNWSDVENNAETQKILKHWQTLAMFKKNHPSVGVGKHAIISKNPYVFSRSYNKGEYSDKVVVVFNTTKGENKVPVEGVFVDGEIVRDAYSNKKVKVKNGIVNIETEGSVILLEAF